MLGRFSGLEFSELVYWGFTALQNLRAVKGSSCQRLYPPMLEASLLVVGVPRMVLGARASRQAAFATRTIIWKGFKTEMSNN